MGDQEPTTDLRGKQSHQAYERGDGAQAKSLSDEGKRHAAAMDDYNRQASEYIFRENNAPGRVTEDAIDLHGQFADEAARILEQRIRADQSRGQAHLHAIVGKGNHSAGHVQKVKPRVEQLCRDLGLQSSTEENAGRIYINLQGGPATSPPPMGQPHGGGGYQSQPGYGGGYAPPPPQQHGRQYQGQHGQQQHGQQQHGGQQQQQQGQGNDQIEQMVEKLLPRVLRRLEKACCTVM